MLKQIDPTNIKAYFRRALASKALGNVADAARDLQEVVKLDPTNTAAKKELNECLSKIPKSAPKEEPKKPAEKPKIQEISPTK